MAMIKCPQCGAEISDKAKKCIHCGKVLVGEPIADVPEKNTKICPECGKEVPIDSDTCPVCGYPFEEAQEPQEQIEQVVPVIVSTEEAPVKAQSKKNIIIVVAVLVVVLICGLIYYFVSVRPKSIYEEANTLWVTGQYEEADELFAKITSYKDVEELREQLKYESYAFDCANILRGYLKVPDSYKALEVVFYRDPGVAHPEEGQTDEDIQPDYHPHCIMRYGANNSYGAMVSSYAYFDYDYDESFYILLGTCNSLNIDSYDDDELVEKAICQIINQQIVLSDEEGSIDLTRLQTAIDNNPYSSIAPKYKDVMDSLRNN